MIHNRNLVYGQFTDVDAAVFATKVALTSAEEDAVKAFILGLKSNGLWPKIKMIFPFLGGTQSSCRYDMVSANSSAYDLVWYGTASSFANGFNGNGSQFAQLGSSASLADLMAASNFGITMANGLYGSVIADECTFGVYGGVGGGGVLLQLYSGAGFKLGSNNNMMPSVSTGIYTLTSNSGKPTIYTSGVFNDGATDTLSLGGSSWKFTIGALNVNNFTLMGYTPIGSNKRIQTFVIHELLSSTELSLLHNIINNFENGLGRKTW